MSLKIVGLSTAAVVSLLAVACSAGDESALDELESGEQALRVSIPARIEAEAYEFAENETTAVNQGGQCDRGDGVDMESTADMNGVCNVGWTAPGERLHYHIATPVAGTFDVTARVASTSLRGFHLELNGTNIGALTSPNEGWQAFQDRTVANVNVPAGDSTLSVVFDAGEVNLNYLDLRSSGSTGCVSRPLTPQAAVASSLEAPTLDATKAIDGDPATRWSSAWSDPQWLEIDLGAAQRIMGVELDWEAAASADYDVQVSSDRASWATVYTDAAGNGGLDVVSGLTNSARYVRMYSRARVAVNGTRYGNSLFELRVNGDPNPECSTSNPSCSDGLHNGTETGIDCGGSCPPCSTSCLQTEELPRVAAEASSQEASYAPGLAVDGDPSTRWSSEFSDPQWISVDLGAPRRISRVLLTWEAAYSRSYEIQVRSSTAEPWSTVQSVTSGDGGTDDIANLSAVARYVRMFSKARGTGWGNSLFEFRVFGDADASCSASCVNPDAGSALSGIQVDHPNVGVRQVTGDIGFAARLARDPVSGALHYMTLFGDIYRVDLPFGTSTLVVSGSQVVAGMNPAVFPSTYQGMAFAPDGTLYVVFNAGEEGRYNRAYVRRGVGTGSRTWSTLASTDRIPESNTPFDHHFSGIVVSPDGSSVYLTSGSRTDHGELQENGTNFPGTREVALTAAMFRLPAGGSNLVLANDSAALQANGYLYARGLRNSYDPVFGPGGELFAGDNGPDADYSEELNAVRFGQHYGFPWRLGAEDNAQQFSDYDPASDPRLDPDFTAVRNGTYRNDPTFPSKPLGVTLVDPIPNVGPDADQYRDLVSGGIADASDEGRALSTFTAHRVPLGLSFDLGGSLCGELQNKAFIMSWGSALPRFPDKGEDVLLLDIHAAGAGYDVSARQFATGLSRPIDSVLIGNKLYVLEYSDTGSGRLIEFALPRAQ